MINARGDSLAAVNHIFCIKIDEPQRDLICRNAKNEADIASATQAAF